MSKNTYVAAHTAVVGTAYYPPYVNMTGDEDGVRITVRGKEQSPGVCGPQADIKISREDFAALVKDIVAWALQPQPAMPVR